MADPRFKWYGDKVQKDMARAAAMGINRTMALCVGHAKNNHPWKNRTATAEKSIKIAAAATPGPRAIGIWGSTNNNYFASLELGSKPHPIYPKRGKVIAFTSRSGQKVVVKYVPKHPGNKPMPTLVPTSKKIYPLLPEQIKRAFLEVSG